MTFASLRVLASDAVAGPRQSFHKVEHRPHNRYHTCARRKQASLCDLQGMNVRDVAAHITFALCC